MYDLYKSHQSQDHELKLPEVSCDPRSPIEETVGENYPRDSSEYTPLLGSPSTSKAQPPNASKSN